MKYTIYCAAFILLLSACGKKEWPQPVAGDELVKIDHLEAKLNQDCLQVNVKVGGNLANLEYFLVEIEKEGCPTCPFSPTISRKFFPYSEGVYRKDNNYVLTVCQPMPTNSFRIRVKADNTYHIVQPAVSGVITVPVQAK